METIPRDWHKTAGALEPIHIRAYLRTPVIADRFLPLDGLLLYQAHRALAGGGPEQTIPGGEQTNTVSRLPLGTVRHGRRDWYYKCSWAQWSHTVEGRDHWNKRFDSAIADMVDFQGKRGKVIIEQGKYRAYHMPVFYRSALWIDWYAVGCLASLQYLLQIVTHIGKKASQGWGRVKEWVVEPWPDDWSTWVDGRLMRGVPQKDALAFVQQSRKFAPFDILHYGIRPSYYRANNQMSLAVPK
jgi:CRISPR type IV-associated protein Csf3